MICFSIFFQGFIKRPSLLYTERNLISSSSIFKSNSKLLGNVINEWKQYITFRHRLKKHVSKKNGKSEESNCQTIP